MTTRRTQFIPALLACAALSGNALSDIGSLAAHAAGKPNYNQKLMLANSMFFNGNVEGAIRALQTCVELKPDAFDPHFMLINLYVSNSDVPKALDECRVCLKLRPDHRDCHLLLGNLIRAQAGNETDPDKATALHKEAKETLTKALQLGANKGLCENMLSMTCLQLKQHDEAMTHIDNAIKAAPNLADAHLIRGVLLFRKLTAPAQSSGTKIDLSLPEYKAQINDILSELDLSIKYKPKNADAKNTKGDILLGLGKTDEAIATYQSVLQDDPHYFMALLAMGNYYVGKNDYGKSLDYFQRAHDVSPNDRNAMYGLALTLERTGNPSAAISLFQQASANEPDAALKAQIGMHVQQLQGVGAQPFFNIGSISLPTTETVDAKLLTPSNAELKSETQSITKMKAPPSSEEHSN